MPTSTDIVPEAPTTVSLGLMAVQDQANAGAQAVAPGSA